MRDVWKWKFSKYAKRSKIRLGYFEWLIKGSKVFFKENIKTIGRLDYQKEGIKMQIQNCAQLTRLYACGKEPETVAWIEKEMKMGDTFYDIGAHVGAYSFVAWAVAKKNCKIYAFEPNVDIFYAFKSNILLNHAESEISAFPVALGHKTEIAPSPIYRLDDFVRFFSPQLPNLLKIDVDGPELSVIEGAPETLSFEGLRSILIEIDEQIYSNKEIDSFFKRYGFYLKSKHQRGRGTLFNCIFERK